MADITGYKVRHLWSTVPGKLSSTTHAVGDVLAPHEVQTKRSLGRDAHLAELVRIGCLAPLYEPEPAQEAPQPLHGYHHTGPLAPLEEGHVPEV